MKKVFKRPALVLTALILAAGLAGCKNASGSEPEFEIEDGVLKKYRGESAEVIIPDGVTKIGGQAFENNLYVERVIIPEGVTEIGTMAFFYCSNLKSVEIPDTVTIIGNSAFYGCENLVDVRIPSGVTVIDFQVFAECTKLRDIEIPDGVTSIVSTAFHNTGIEYVEIPGSVEYLSGFRSCSKLQTVYIKEGVKHIQGSAFRNCENLETITIPSTIESIYYDAFEGCTALSSVNYNGTVEEWRELYGSTKIFEDIEDVIVLCTPGSIEYRKGEEVVGDESDASASE